MLKLSKQCGEEDALVLHEMNGELNALLYQFIAACERIPGHGRQGHDGYDELLQLYF